MRLVSNGNTCVGTLGEVEGKPEPGKGPSGQGVRQKSPRCSWNLLTSPLLLVMTLAALGIILGPAWPLQKMPFTQLFHNTCAAAWW